MARRGTTSSTTSESTTEEPTQATPDTETGETPASETPTSTQNLVDQAKLDAAESQVTQQKSELLATGQRSAEVRLEEAEANLEKVRGEIDDPDSFAKMRGGITANLAPHELTAMVRQIDTSGTTGFSDSSALVDAANVFGHPVQQAVAKSAFQSAPGSDTVVTVVTQDPAATKEQVLKAAGVVTDVSGNAYPDPEKDQNAADPQLTASQRTEDEKKAAEQGL